MNSSMIPNHTLNGLVNYIEHGCPPGGFLNAVLIGDLFDACGRADNHNQRALSEIVRWLYNVPPAGCKGSRDRVQAWLAMTPEDRTMILAQCPSWQDFKQEESVPAENEDSAPLEVA